MSAGHPEKLSIGNDQQFSSHIHNIRHSFYALRTGIGLLKVRCQEEQLTEMCGLLADEERTTSRLTEELIAAVREHTGSA